jgi:hypothetical protein
VTLDTDTEEVVRKRMQERGQSFKQALNDIIREGATGARPAEPFRTKVASMGVSAVNLDRALQVAADLEDDDLIRRKRSGS